MLSGGCWGLPRAGLGRAGEPSQPEGPGASGRLVRITQPSGFNSLCPGCGLREGKAGEGPTTAWGGWRGPESSGDTGLAEWKILRVGGHHLSSWLCDPGQGACPL